MQGRYAHLLKLLALAGIFLLIAVVGFFSAFANADDSVKFPLSTPAHNAKPGMWTTGDIVRPHTACWEHKSFLLIKEAIIQGRADLYLMLMNHPNIQCQDREPSRVPVEIGTLDGVADFPDTGYQVRMWKGLFGPNKDLDVWLFNVVPYGVLKHHKLEVPEGVILWPGDYLGWRPDGVGKPAHGKRKSNLVEI